MSERQLRWVELSILILGVVLGGMLAFNNLSTRIALAEQTIKQESTMYQAMQIEVGRRLERMESKIDILSERIH